MKDAIYQQFVAHCEPYPLPELWRAVGSPVETYRSPRYGTATLARLTEAFTEYDLVTSGLAQRDPEGILLSAAVAEQDGALVVLREFADALPYGIMIKAGILGYIGPSITGYLETAGDAELDQSDGILFVAFSMDDVIALRSVGFAAVHATGPAGWNADQVRDLCTRCGWPTFSELLFAARSSAEPEHSSETPEDTESGSVAADLPSNIGQSDEARSTSGSEVKEKQPPSLTIVLVGWFPATLTCSTPADLRELAAFLSRVERHLDRHLSNVGIWQPTTEAVDGLRFHLQFGDRVSVRALILDNVEESSRSLDGIADQVAQPGDFAMAEAEAHRAVRVNAWRADCVDRSQAALARLDEQVQRELIVPLIEQATQSDDAVMRSQLLALAPLSRLVHQQAPLVQREVRSVAADRRDVRGDGAIRTLLDTVDRLCKLSELIQRRR